MDFRRLEEDVQSALEQYFERERDDGEGSCGGKLLCALPMMIDIINWLVLPVMVVVISDYLLQNVVPWRTGTSDKTQKRVEELEAAAKETICQRCASSPALKGQSSEAITKYIYIILAEQDALRIDPEQRSPLEIQKIISALESMLENA
nr:hypothetical protein [uncultured Oscillibacter sp.]